KKLGFPCAERDFPCMSRPFMSLKKLEHSLRYALRTMSTPSHIAALGVLILVVIVPTQHIVVMIVHFVALGHLDAATLGQSDPPDRLFMVIKDDVSVPEPPNHFSRDIDPVSISVHPSTPFVRRRRWRKPARRTAGRLFRKVSYTYICPIVGKFNLRK